MAGPDTSATYYQDVRVPVTTWSARRTAAGSWSPTSSTTSASRWCRLQPIFLALNAVREWAQNTKDIHGSRLIDSEWVQLNLARVHAKAEVLKLINWELASSDDAAPSPADASAAKVFGTELATEAYRLLMEVLGTAATVRPGLAGRAAARPGRADASRVPDPDVRRRHQRDPARHHRDGRARLAPSRTADTPRAERKRLGNAMDFTTTEAATDLGGLVRTITESVCTPQRQRDLDKLDQRFDRELWRKLIDADVLSTAAPESVGGGGFGVLEQAAVLTALGRALAAVPYLESVVLGAGALAAFGPEALQKDWAAAAINGEKILAIALDGEMGQGPVQATASRRRVSADRHPHPGRLRPGRGRVPGAGRNRVGCQVFLVEVGDAGVSVTSLNTTGHGQRRASGTAGRRAGRQPGRRRDGCGRLAEGPRDVGPHRISTGCAGTGARVDGLLRS